MKIINFPIFSFISVVLERCPDDEEVRNILESINTNIQEQKKGKKGANKKNSKRVGTSSCLSDSTENISRIFRLPLRPLIIFSILQRSCRNDSCKAPQGSSCKYPANNLFYDPGKIFNKDFRLFKYLCKYLFV